MAIDEPGGGRRPRSCLEALSTLEEANANENTPLIKRYCENKFSKHDKPKKKPWLLKYRSSTTFITITICIALFTDSVIYGIMVPVIPFVLHDRSKVADEDVQYWSSAMFAAFGACILVGSPLSGWYADHHSSRRRPLLVGLLAMGLATVLLGFSYAAWLIVLSRALQGLSTGVVYTVGLALLVDTVGKDDVGKWIGVAMSSESVGLVISPMMGGLAYPKLGVWGVVGLTIVLIALNGFLLLVLIEKRTARKYRPRKRTTSTAAVLNYETFMTGCCHFCGIAFSEEEPSVEVEPNQIDKQEANSKKCGSCRSSSNVSGSEVGTVEDISGPRNSKLSPMMRLLTSPRIIASVYGVLVQFGQLASFDAVLPIFVKRTFGWDAMRAGLVFLNLAVPAMLGPLAGKLSDRFGPRRIALVGCVLTTPPLVLLRLVTNNSTEHALLLCVLLVFIGAFLTLIISPLAADLSFAVDAMEDAEPGVFGEKGAYGQVYALFTCAMAGAELIGPIIAGAVGERFGWGTMALMLGLWCASVAIPVILFTGDRIPESRPNDPEIQSTDDNESYVDMNHD